MVQGGPLLGGVSGNRVLANRPEGVGTNNSSAVAGQLRGDKSWQKVQGTVSGGTLLNLASKGRGNGSPLGPPVRCRCRGGCRRAGTTGCQGRVWTEPSALPSPGSRAKREDQGSMGTEKSDRTLPRPPQLFPRTGFGWVKPKDKRHGRASPQAYGPADGFPCRHSEARDPTPPPRPRRCGPGLRGSRGGGRPPRPRRRPPAAPPCWPPRPLAIRGRGDCGTAAVTAGSDGGGLA